jgi:hypothetical protein
VLLGGDLHSLWASFCGSTKTPPVGWKTTSHPFLTSISGPENPACVRFDLLWATGRFGDGFFNALGLFRPQPNLSRLGFLRENGCTNLGFHDR